MKTLYALHVCCGIVALGVLISHEYEKTSIGYAVVHTPYVAAATVHEPVHPLVTVERPSLPARKPARPVVRVPLANTQLVDPNMTDLGRAYEHSKTAPTFAATF